MLINDITKKEQRSITRDINMICSLKGWTVINSIKDFKKIGARFSDLKIKNKELFFTTEGKDSFERICKIIFDHPISLHLEYNDVYQCIRKEFEKWLTDGFIPNLDEYISALNNSLTAEIKEFRFISLIKGVELIDIPEIVLGTTLITTFSSNWLTKPMNVSVLENHIMENYEKKLVITKSEKGSHSYAEQQFFENSDLILSVLRMAMCAIYTTGILKGTINMKGERSDNYDVVNNLAISTCGQLTQSGQSLSAQDFKINPTVLNQMNEDLLMQDIANIIDTNERNEVEDAIVNSVYWIGEAHKDFSHSSAWTKLWFSLESYFSLKTEEITEKNAMGIASIMVYLLNSEEDYKKLKAEVKKYYSIRSKISHRAKFKAVSEADLSRLGYIASWVTISITALTKQGYSTLKEINDEANRINSLHTSSNSN